jgi:endoglucanase
MAQVDLVGGYYDAGDNVKYGLPMAFTITTLSWAALFYKTELQAAGELEHVHSAIRWGTDYFLKASSRRQRLYVQVRVASLNNILIFFVIFVFDLRTLFMHVRSNEIVMGVCLLMVKVGDPVQDHQCWIRPENMQTPRTVLKIDENTPGTEIAAETSAAMAASSIVFRGIDHPYSRRLLNKAKLVFQIGSPFNFHWNSFCS